MDRRAVTEDNRGCSPFRMDANHPGYCVVRNDITLAAYLEAAYVPGKLDLRAGTVEQLAIAVHQIDTWHGSPVRLAELTTDLVRRFLREYRGRVSAATVNNKRRGLLAIWRWAHEEGDVIEPPGRIPLCRESHELPQAWTVDEVERIIAVARALPGRVAGLPAKRWWPSLLLSAYDSAARIGSLLATAPSNISMTDRSLVLLGSNTKTGTPQFCRLSDQTVAAIAAIYDPARKLVWPWPHQRKTLYRHMRRLLETADVPHGKGNGGLFHKLRRTSGSLVAANGGNPQLHLGHASAATTYRHYVDPRALGNGQLDYLPRPGQPGQPGCGAWLLD